MAAAQGWTTTPTIAELVRVTRARSGVPEKVTDPVVLDRIAELMADHDAESRAVVADLEAETQ